MNISMTEVTEKINAKNRCIEGEVDKLKSKIGKVEDYAKDDLNKGLAKLKKQILGDIPISEIGQKKSNTSIDFGYLLRKIEREAE